MAPLEVALSVTTPMDLVLNPLSFTTNHQIEDYKPGHTTERPKAALQYIAVGCLCFIEPTRDTKTTDTDLHWGEIRTVDDIKQLLPSDLPFIGPLLEAKWIRILATNRFGNIVLRIYVLPDDVAQTTYSRHSLPLRTKLFHLCSRLDVSSLAWSGNPAPSNRYTKFDSWSTGIDRSLLWLFNSLPSPQPDPWGITDRFMRHAAEDILSSCPGIPDLKASLYPYQARTVAMMMQKEVASQRTLDPRFEERESLEGIKYYYNARDTQFRLDPPQFESSRGGILAETMGVGKTVMCIALILATKYHLPRIPPQYSTYRSKREQIGSLAEMAVSNAGRFSVPLRSHFHMFYNPDMDLRTFTSAIKSNVPQYDIPYVMRRSNRKNSIIPPPRKLLLCSTTLVVVPRNLLHQWQAELEKHAVLGPEALRVLVMETPKDILPAATEIAKFDIILFSKTRFEAEHKDGQDNQGRSNTNVRAGCACPYIGATRIRDCSCLKPEDVYSSPLKELHFLRIIIDEGHEFSSSTSNAVKVATSIVTAERRWVVSGTPAKERLVDIDSAVASSHRFSDVDKEDDTLLDLAPVQDRRKVYVKQEEMNGASKSIGVLLSNFLRVRPWAGTDDELKVDWEDYAFRHEVPRGRTHTMFSQCMVSTLNSLVLKTRPDDVDRDVPLPPLRRTVKYLKPSFYDIATLNLFIFFMTANAITSERTDVDYLFHKNSTSARHALIRNLRHSAFFWTGFTETDVIGAIGNSERYLSKPEDMINCSAEDRKNLERCIAFARNLLNSHAWKSLSVTHELGLFIDQWPDESQDCWSLNGTEKPLMVGATQARSAQEFINTTLFNENPTQGLDVLGKEGLRRTMEAELENEAKAKKRSTTTSKLGGVPMSAFQDKGVDSRHNVSPKKATSKRQHPPVPSDVEEIPSQHQSQQVTVKRKRSGTNDTREVPTDSALAKTSIVGTVSRKLTYLVDRVMDLHVDEKILIFYDSDNAAFYLSQVLDLVHIKHLIYSRHLKPDKRSKYIVTFDTDVSVRVLLMDISHGAFGLNINKASRVFFINPPIAPHTEHQAIKRAHRIGQTKPVYVETLVLEGTIEHSIFERGKKMTPEEHDRAGKEISNDQGVATIIQSAETVPVTAEHSQGMAQLAPFDKPLQLFGRQGRHDTKIKGIDPTIADEKARSKKKRKKDEAVPTSSQAMVAGIDKSMVFVDTGELGDRSIFG